jgi:hypothetical protein
VTAAHRCVPAAIQKGPEHKRRENYQFHNISMAFCDKCRGFKPSKNWGCKG